MIDYLKAANAAMETLIKYGVKSSPVSVLPILEQMENVIVVPFDDMSKMSGVSQNELANLFGKNRDAVTSVYSENGEKKKYIVAYNSLLPFSMVQRALAREMGHIVLRHESCSIDAMEEATCFSHHLLCPRPLVHAIQSTGIRFSMDMLANLTGVFDQCLLCIRHTPGTNVPAQMNRFVRGQFMPFIMNFFDFYQNVLPKDGSALVDFGTYMDGYEE